jgi:hypothetical protein
MYMQNEQAILTEVSRDLSISLDFCLVRDFRIKSCAGNSKDITTVITQL